MPRIPTYQQETRASAAGLGPGPAVHPGAALLTVGAAGLSAIDQVNRRAEATEVAETLANLRLKSAQRFIDAKANAAPDGKDFTPGVLDQFDADLEEAKAGASTSRARAFLHDASIALREDVGQRALAYEAVTRNSARTAQAKSAIDTTRNTLELDPDQFESAMGEQDAAINAMGLPPEQRQALREYLVAQGYEGAAIGVAKQDPADALKKLATATSGDSRFDRLDANQRHQIERFAKDQLADKQAQGILAQYRTDARAGSAALTALDKSDLPPEEKDVIRARVAQGMGLIHAERRQQYGEQVTDLERRITQNAPGPNAEAQAANLYRKGAYTAEQYTNVLQAIDAARMEGAKNGAATLSVQEALRLGLRLDPKDEKIVKAVDTAFTQMMDLGQVAPGSDEWVNAAASIANRTNILPPSAMSWARATILSGEPKLVGPAAAAISRFAESAPTAYAYFDDPNLKAYAEQVSSLVAVGASPASATETVRENMKIPKARQDELRAIYTKEKYAGENTGELQSLMDSDDAFDVAVIGGAPGPSLAMRDEYNAAVRTYFEKTNGNIKAARELAWKDIRGVYGYSKVNGEPEILKHAPELRYPGVDVTVIRSDIDAVGKAAGITTPVRMVPSQATDTTQGLLWELHTTDEDGYEVVLLDEQNRPVQYAIPTDTKPYLDAQEKAKAEAVERARKVGEQRRKALDNLGNAMLESASLGY